MEKICRVCLAAASCVKLTFVNLSAFYTLCSIDVGSCKDAMVCQYCCKRITQTMKLVAAARRADRLLRSSARAAGSMSTELHPYKQVKLLNTTTCEQTECLMHALCVDQNKQGISDLLAVNEVSEEAQDHKQQYTEFESVDVKEEFVYEDIEDAINYNVVKLGDYKQEIEGFSNEVDSDETEHKTIVKASTSKCETIQKPVLLSNATANKKKKATKPAIIKKQIDERTDIILNKSVMQVNTFEDCAKLKNVINVVPYCVPQLVSIEHDKDFIVDKNPVLTSKKTATITDHAVNVKNIKTTSNTNKTKNDVEDTEQIVSDSSQDDIRHASEKEKGLANKLEMITLSFEQAKEEIEKMKQSNRYINSLYKCECGKGYQDQSAYTNHMEWYHNQINDFECNICYYRFHTENTLSLHYSLYHINKWRCQQCDTVVRRNCWSSHKLKCWEQSLQCAVCNKTLKNRKTLAAHMDISHKEREHKCEVCGKTFTGAWFLNKHKRIHSGEKPFACPHCEKSFMVFTNLRIHIRGVHETDPKDQRHCAECDKYFKTPKLLEIHLKTSQSHSDPESIRFECHDCGVLKTSKTRLQDHILRVHLKRKDHVCVQCNKGFNTNSELRTHIKKAHQPKVRKHVCSTCDQAFTSLKYLGLHTSAVHGLQRPFVCELCGDTFGFKSALYIHRKLKHEGAKRTKGKFYYPDRKGGVSSKE